MQEYCFRFTNCNTCKKASTECEWCHSIGCTSKPKIHCPKKMFLDLIDPRAHKRICTELIADGPVFVPSNAKKLKLPLQIDDLTIYGMDVRCEFYIEGTVIVTRAYLTKENETVICDTKDIVFTKGVVVGYVRLFWGGVEPRSNSILIILYDCQMMAETCNECQKLEKSFQCGWCKSSFRCTLKEECSNRFGRWIPRENSCLRAKKKVLTQYSKYNNKKSNNVLFKYV